MEKNSFFDFNWWSYTFENKWALLLLLILPTLFYLEKKRISLGKLQLKFSTTQTIPSHSWINSLPWILIILKLISLLFIILALSKPYLESEGSLIKREVEAIDIVIALDVSESMMAEDFRPNRLEASKEVGINFIKDRPQDRIGLVIYEGESFTLCPLTNDHSALIEKFKDVHSGLMEPGTAIGMGLATAVNRLKDSKAKSKVIILLSDGVNNRGNIDPVTAAELAKEFSITVYSIGVGKNGVTTFPMRDPFGGIMKVQMPVEIDETSLKEIARLTHGQYFRAENKNALEKIYKEIDKMEKTKVKINEFKIDPPEKFHTFLFFGICLFLFVSVTKLSILRSVND